MTKTMMTAAAALTAVMIPVGANAATNIDGDDVQCSVSGPSAARCNLTNSTTGGARSRVAVVDADGSAPEFFINVPPSSGSANPLLTADFGQGILTLQGIGGVARTFSNTSLFFTNLDRRFTGASGTGALANRVFFNSGVIELRLTGSAWSEATIGTAVFTAVPEPGAWLLMILGLGAVGFSMRRRQNTSVRLQFA